MHQHSADTADLPTRDNKAHAGASGLPRLSAADLKAAVLEQLRLGEPRTANRRPCKWRWPADTGDSPRWNPASEIAAELARKEGVDGSYVSRMANAPSIFAAIKMLH